MVDVAVSACEKCGLIKLFNTTVKEITGKHPQIKEPKLSI
jgi:hypothetical protein